MTAIESPGLSNRQFFYAWNPSTGRFPSFLSNPQPCCIVIMFKLLQRHPYGFDTSKIFATSFANVRIPELALSSRFKVLINCTPGIECLDIDRDEERFLLSGGNDGNLYLHDLEKYSCGKWAQTVDTDARVMKGTHSYAHRFSVQTVQWYPFDTGMFTSSSYDATLKIWDTNIMKPVETKEFQQKVVCHHMSPIPTHSSLIAVALAHPHLVLVDTRTGLYSHQLRGHKIGVCNVKWSPSCDHLLATGGMDSKILLWDVRKPSSYLRVLDQYNMQTQSQCEENITSHYGYCNAMQFTNDGLFLVSYGSDCELRLWDVALCKNTLVNFGSRITLTSKGHAQKHIEICCDTNPPVVFVPTSNRIICYNIFTGCRVKVLKGHLANILCCRYRSKLHQLLSGGDDRDILVWSPDTKLEKMEHRADIKQSVPHEFQYSESDSDSWSSDEEIL